MRSLHSFYVMFDDPAPPSINKMYTTFRGRRVLTKAGRNFKAALGIAIIEETSQLSWKQAVEDVYVRGAGVHVVIALSLDLFNLSWVPGGITENGELQSPYKKKDATSYIKIIEDAVAEATGIDDSAHMRVTVDKRDSDKPFIEVTYVIIQNDEVHPSLKEGGKRRRKVRSKISTPREAIK